MRVEKWKISPMRVWSHKCVSQMRVRSETHMNGSWMVFAQRDQNDWAPSAEKEPCITGLFLQRAVYYRVLSARTALHNRALSAKRTLHCRPRSAHTSHDSFIWVWGACKVYAEGDSANVWMRPITHCFSWWRIALSCEWVMAHMNESWHIWMSRGIYGVQREIRAKRALCDKALFTKNSPAL
jgi:hypothetical protein